MARAATRPQVEVSVRADVSTNWHGRNEQTGQRARGQGWRGQGRRKTGRLAISTGGTKLIRLKLRAATARSPAT